MDNISAVCNNHIYKTSQGDTTTGTIRIPAILYPGNRPDSLTGTNVVSISCGDAVTRFFGYLPAGKLADCTVHTYCPNHFSDAQNYKKVSGIIYFYGGFLKIAPDTDYWKFFYGADSEDVNYANIGLVEDLTFSFTVPSTAPTYSELRTTWHKLISPVCLSLAKYLWM